MRRSSQNYVRLNKKITSPEVIEELTQLTKDLGMPAPEICYKFIYESVMLSKKQRGERMRTVQVPHFDTPKK
jgi:hypothetical protein